MYGTGICEKQASGMVGGSDYNPTVGENLDARIRQMEVELERLKESRETLAPLLGMRIRDIRDAMSY